MGNGTNPNRNRVNNLTQTPLCSSHAVVPIVLCCVVLCLFYSYRTPSPLLLDSTGLEAVVSCSIVWCVVCHSGAGLRIIH